MNESFFFFPIFESCFLFRKRKGRFTRLPTIAGLITAAITGRGNLEVHAVQPRWGQTPRPWRILPRSGSRLSSFSHFPFFFARRGKIEARDKDPRSRAAEESNGGRKPPRSRKRLPEISLLQLKKKNRWSALWRQVTFTSGISSRARFGPRLVTSRYIAIRLLPLRLHYLRGPAQILDSQR